jgi:small GTP-binding protein
MKDGPSPVPTEFAGGVVSEELAELALAVENLSGAHGDLATRIVRLAARMGAARYHIAVLGDFKRGKSTLINALLGQALLPSGVVPLTAVATEVHFGGTETAVVFRDGTRRTIDPDEIADYVTEQANPCNAKGVEHTEVGVAAGFGVPGLVLVDTPGLSSVNESNTEEAQRALRDADGAIVVLAADNPLSRSERDVLELLAARRAKVFLVINRCDALTPPELGEVRSFVAEIAGQALGEPIRPFCVSARNALERADGARADSIEFDEFRGALVRFVEHDLAAARRTAALAELNRLGGELERTLDLEEAADALDIAALDQQIVRLSRVVDEGRRLLSEDVVVLRHDAESLLDEAGSDLSGRAAAAARRCTPELAATVADLPRGQLESGTRDVIEDLIRAHFEPVRAEVAEQVEGRWAALADRFNDRVREQIAEVVETASDLFAVHLPHVEVPDLHTWRGQFSYHFFYAESQNAVLGRAVGRFVPSAIARRRTLRLATRRMRKEFDKHAGRARYDTAERLHSAVEELTRSMAFEFEQTQASLLAACAEARGLRELGEAARSARAELRAQLRGHLSRVEAVVGGEQG